MNGCKWFCRHKRAVLDLEMELSDSKSKSGFDLYRMVRTLRCKRCKKLLQVHKLYGYNNLTYSKLDMIINKTIDIIKI
jgi:hypothetical protein